ncbi:peptidoglycan-binding domain-containing protein [Nocardiopsis sp. FIRDI 009]|uniref:peptidoglycan recognition protein family protein n=1 Tax=Nocardiopsis sp. FIRDI 009 TaxID=714197 RepID=UPI000E228810|nr:peptidoglycan-binding domain-containing protein [Nocardiopsis sp. FIRDI 009]
MPQPPLYVSRIDLGWSETSPAAYADPKSGLVVHYDGVDQYLADQDHAACLDYWQVTRDFHTGPERGWADVGYSFMACAHGYVIEGRGLYREQAAQRGANDTHYSVTLAAGPTDRITDVQIEAVRELRAWLMEPDASISGAVFGHRDFNATSCPGDDAYALVRDGTFAQQPGNDTPMTNGDDDMLGLKLGDTGEAVKLLQLKVTRAGFGAALGESGVDGDYGPATAEAVRQTRAYVGSKALEGYGDWISAHAKDQVDAAVIKRMLADGGASTSGGGTLPETVRVTGELTVEG